ncbi:MAG: DUF4209 domain-containing protein [Lentisphaerae bacterium]|nr:DUF4209 domain-containing protein [Lentisphaerota bacterium]
MDRCMNLVKKFAYGIGLDASQALAMLAMSYQVRPMIDTEPHEKFDDDLFVIPDICMGRGNDAEEYRVALPGYLLDASKLDESRVDYYLQVSLRVASTYLVHLKANIDLRYNNVGMEYFDFLVSKASCVSQNYKKQFAKGLYYGYLCDYHTACCLIVPLIEQFVRGLCVANKISIEDRNGLPLGLGKLLNKDDTKELFSKGAYFEIKALLTGKKGLNLRNLLAHGAITDKDSDGIEFFYMWWFALRMVVNLRMVNRGDGSLSEAEHSIA